MSKSKFLLLFLLSLISCDLIWVEYDTNQRFGKQEITHVEETQMIALNLNTTMHVDDYMKVTVTPKENTETPLLCFSPTDAGCEKNRQVISRVTNGEEAILLLKREQFFEGSDELNVFVTCQKKTCSYTITFEGCLTAEITPKTTYSYYVTKANRDMIFEVFGEGTEEGSLTIGIEGSTTAKIDLEGIDKSPYQFGTGQILNFEIENENNSTLLARFWIRGASDGDYITLNVHTVSNSLKAPDNLLYPNGPVVMGMLEKKEGLIEECFPMSALVSEKFKNVNKYYLSIKVHSKYALFWLGDENDMYMDETEKEITDGLYNYLIENEGKMRYVCFEFSYEDWVENKEYVAYSLSVIEPTRLENFYDFYPPQILNQIYPRIIPKGSIAVYHAGETAQSDKRLSFNIYNRKGVAELYVQECRNFPNCTYEVKDLDIKNKVKNLNKMSIMEKTITKDYSALEKEKFVMIVYCKDDDNENKGYCEIESSILAPRKEITLIENEDFSKYVLKNDQGSFKLDFKNAVKIQRVSIDIMIFSGDVTFNVNSLKSNDGKLTDEPIDLNHYKYYLSNKVYFHYIFDQVELTEMTINYKAELNSFFSIKYDIDYSNLVQTQEEIRSGKSYLVEIDPTSSDKTKYLFLENSRYKKEKPFLANFFALNCDFRVTRDEKEISFFDGYAQEILLSSSSKYKSEKYKYKVNITEADLSNYNHKMCMLYVAGYESVDDSSISEIVIGENINQQIIFDDNFNNVRFLYPHADPDKDLALYVNVIDQAYYNVEISFNNEEQPYLVYKVTRSQIFYISKNDITNHCERDTLCNIVINATFTEPLSSMPKTEPMMEITIRQIKNNPSYLQKSRAKKDFTCGDNFYYLYTEIGKNEVGEITVNFLRDFGYVWAKVVRKDQNSIDQEANWRGIYRMPSKDWEDSLPYNDYTKKIYVDISETQDCIEGCYLLISVQISQIGEYVDDSKFYPFSIIARINPNSQAYTDTPKVVIQVNEYIIGNVDLGQNERISQFYEVWLPHDSFEINFDWQSKVAGLYINLGGIRPTTRNADFILLPPGRDSILILSKSDILAKAKEKNIKLPYTDSIQDVNLVIGVWTDKTDSFDTEIYSLRVHQPIDALDILELNTDQKFICIPQYLDDDQYRCLFMVTYDDEDERLQMPLFVHAASVNQSATTNAYGSFIERKYYDQLDLDTLRSRIPTFETASYSTARTGLDYLYTTLSFGRDKFYFFVNVISDRSDNIMIITSLPMYNILNPQNYEFYPNPSSEQLLSVSVEKLKLKFFTTSSLIVNIVTLGGEAEVIWEKDPNTVYNLRGKGDRLSLTSGTNLNEIIITKRSEQKPENEDDAGFVFYVSYLMRDEDNNFDEIQYGKSLEIGYRDTHLPVHLYSKIGSTNTDLNLAVTFRDSDIDVEGEYIFSPLIVRAALAKESTIYKSKQSSELAPSFGKTVFGIYDPAIKTAQVFLDVDAISSFNVRSEDNPTLYLSIEESESVPSQKYSKFSIEAQFNIINSGIIPAEKSFNYGRFSGKILNAYRLKIDKSKTYMIIEIAFNSELLTYAINDQLLMRNNTELIVKSQKARGKSLLTVKNPKNTEFLYLLIFHRNNDISKNYDTYYLFNYVFKYINVEKEDEFTDFKILGNKNELEYEEKDDEEDKTLKVIKCTFNKIDIDKDKANITYFFKVVENSTLIYGESVETIAVMQSDYYTVYKRNPEDNNGKITLTAKGSLSNWAYLQVIAQIQQDTILDYVAYKGVVNIRPYKKKGSKNGSNTAIFAVVMVILIALVVGLTVAVFIIQKSNKSLINQVKHISFQQSQNQNAAGSGNADPDLLLQKNKQSE